MYPAKLTQLLHRSGVHVEPDLEALARHTSWYVRWRDGAKAAPPSKFAHLYKAESAADSS